MYTLHTDVMVFWWVEFRDTSAAAVVARLSRPLNFSIALREKERETERERESMRITTS